MRTYFFHADIIYNIEVEIMDAKKKTTRRNGADIVRACSTILVPLMIGLLTIAVSIVQLHIGNMQRQQDLHIADQNRQNDIDLANQTRIQDLLIADNERWDILLATYIREISDLFASINFSSTDSNIAHIIRVKTIITLRQLDPIRKAHLIQFLYESRAILNHQNPIDMTNADLNNVDFSIALDNPLKNQINFNQISFRGAMLINSSFSNRQLRGANFSFCLLTNANFENAHVFGTTFESASLRNVNFNNTYTAVVDFGGADLRGAIITDDQLHDARSIFEAMLPNGTFGRNENLVINGDAEQNCLSSKSNQTIIGWTQMTHAGSASVKTMSVNSSLSQIAAEEWSQWIANPYYYNGYKQNWNLGNCSFVAYGYGHVSLFQTIPIPTILDIREHSFAWIISMFCRTFIDSLIRF
jgi:uncharacterized protein YjbI with pentapeptide repeats